VLYRIVRDIGGMTVRELEERMGAVELGEWIALYGIEAAEERRNRR
jgi:hypothetical protein